MSLPIAEFCLLMKLWYIQRKNSSRVLLQKEQKMQLLLILIFSRAQDLTPTQRFWYNFPMRGLFGDNLFRKPYNCINTATKWITNDSTLSQNKKLKSNPQKYGYTNIPIENVDSGDLMQYLNAYNEPYHAGVVLSNNNDTVKVRYSTGGDDLNPIKEYHQSNIQNQSLFYNYKYPRSGGYVKRSNKLIKFKKQGGKL